MTVYEMIQELSRYPADSEVGFNFERRFSADVETEFDRDSENDVQNVTVDVDFDGSIDYYGIRDDYYNHNNPVIEFI